MIITTSLGKLAICPYRPLIEAVENWQYVTDIFEAVDSTEERIALRQLPRQTLKYSYAMNVTQIPAFFNLFYGAMRSQWAVPIWFEGQTLSNVSKDTLELNCTTSRYTFSKLALLWQSPEKWQVLEIDSINSNSLTLHSAVTTNFDECRLYPIKVGWISGDVSRNISGIHCVASATFVIDDLPNIAEETPDATFNGEDLCFKKLLLNGDTVTAVQPSNPESTDLTPVTQQIAFDMPYLELVQRQGQSTIDAILANNPEASFFGVACARPTTGAVAQNAQLYLMSEASGNYLRDSNFDFCPVFTLATDLDYLDTQIITATAEDFSLIDTTEDLPVWAQIDGEIVSITAISADDSNNIVLTVKRGVLDTVPAQHSKDSVGYVWDVMNGGSETEHVETETISAKLVTSSLSALLDVDDATVISATMQGRAYRPYPPANVQIDGKYYPNTVGNKINLTWSHRNRLQQTGGDYLGWVDGNVTLEPDVTYYLTITDEKSNVLFDQNIGAVDQYSFDISASSANHFYITLKSIRDGIECHQVFTHNVKASFEAPYNVKAVFNADDWTKPYNVVATYSE